MTIHALYVLSYDLSSVLALNPESMTIHVLYVLITRFPVSFIFRISF